MKQKPLSLYFNFYRYMVVGKQGWTLQIDERNKHPFLHKTQSPTPKQGAKNLPRNKGLMTRLYNSLWCNMQRNTLRVKARLISDYLMVSPPKSTSKYNGSCHSTAKWGLALEVILLLRIITKKIQLVCYLSGRGENRRGYVCQWTAYHEKAAISFIPVW